MQPNLFFVALSFVQILFMGMPGIDVTGVDISYPLPSN
jgi:hypothetical protein